MIDSDLPWWAVSLAEHEEEEEKVISRELRAQALERDMWMCMSCGNEDLDNLTLHHVVYRSLGGLDDLENLVTLCWECHRKVHDKLLFVMLLHNSWFFKRVM